MKLSIIIPMYNVELYIEKCLLSCLKQDVPPNEYEIIIVNDGSPDGSLAIAERIADINDNIRIISQLNGGLSAARNKGLSLAKGEYVWFIDSDDWIEANCLKYLLSLCNGVDVVAISHSIIEDDKNRPCYVKAAKTGVELLSYGFFQPAQFYIVKKTFLDYYNLRFMVGVFHEDMEFTPRMLYFAKSLITLENCVYNYLQRPASIMSTINPKRAFDLIKVMHSLYNFKCSILEKTHWRIFSNLISLGLNNALYIISQSNSREQNLWVSEIKAKKYLLKELKINSSLKYKKEGFFFVLFPNYIIKIYSLFQKLNLR